MAYHVRLTKHNLLRIAKYRSVRYATLADERFFDRRQVDYLTAGENKCLGNHVNHDIRHETHLYMTRSWPPLAERSRLSQDEENNKAFLLSTQDSESSTCPSCAEINDQSNQLNLRSESRSLLPITLNDLQSIILCNEWNRSSKKDSINTFAKPVSYTGDDILYSEGRRDLKKSSDDIISHENHDVTVLKQVFRSQALKSLEAMTLFCEGTSSSSNETTPQGSGPTKEQLMLVEGFFSETLPSFMRSRQDYRIYHKDIILENNYWGKSTVYRGISDYVMQMTKVRILTHFRFAHAQLQVLKITHHPEDGTVQIRWRISGLPQLKTLMIWRFMPWNYKKNRDTDSEWFDGISTMTVGTDGLVHKHRVDRVMTDEELQTIKPTTNLAAKLAIIFGLTPKPSLNDFSSLFMKKY